MLISLLALILVRGELYLFFYWPWYWFVASCIDFSIGLGIGSWRAVFNTTDRDPITKVI